MFGYSHSMESTIILKKCRSGLGMKIGGGQASDGTFTGIFVKKILIGGAVATDGTLSEGDELLSANGESLKNCTNDQAVSVLRNAAQSGTVKIVFKRDADSRERLEKLFPTSEGALYSKLRQLSLDNSNGGLSRSDSMSSQVSTTSLEKRAWVYTGKTMSPAPFTETQNRGSLDKHSLARMGALDLPLSPRERDFQSTEGSHNSNQRLNTSQLKKAATELDRASSFDSGFPSSGHYSSPDFIEKGVSDITPVIKIEIPAKSNLGISIVGGKNKPEGPHIYVKEVIQGCDAYLDGRIRKGDRIISVNGESFNDVTYEQARSILLRLKLQRDLTHYDIKYVVNSDHVSSPRLHQLTVTPKSREIANTRVSNGFSPTMGEQTIIQESPPIESFISQSSDEEAVVKELMKMMEKSDEYEISMNTDALSKARADVLERHLEDASYSETYEPLRSDLHYLEEASPESNGTVFKPGKFSSPAVENGVPHVHQNDSPAERKTISQYLDEDMNDTYSPRLVSPVSSRKTGRRSRGRRLSLDPMTKLRVEKLEGALNYLGFEATPSKINEIRMRVRVDPNGFVTYGDFVDAAREVYDVRLDDRSKTLNASALQFAMRDIEASEQRERKLHHVVPNKQRQQHIQEIPEEEYPKKEQQQLLQSQSNHSVGNGNSSRLTLKDIEAIEREELNMIARRETDRLGEMQAANRRIQDDLARVSRERDDILRELQFFKRQLNEKNNNTSDIEDQLNRSRQEVANTHREVGELRVRTHLVSTALQEAKQREQQYEQKIKNLSEELEEVKSKNNNGGPKQREFNELQKRLVVLGCQLRKTEVSKRTYEVAVEKLTKFAEHVHDSTDVQRTPTQGRRGSTSKGKSPNYETLAQEARDTVRAVKLLLEEEPLPFGWEEVYAPDGTRYYINHVTQTTSWLHPVSGVQHTGSENGIEHPPTDQKF
ncbi:syntaxin-binding protein 4-like isoform X2 [Rhopilema esculentum]|uniref:syntaxin-binding protein 4-like isoform X2 n=1 Tax=Rhopilema esculentum TaxID=499914 RepID=UPI0031CDE02C